MGKVTLTEPGSPIPGVYSVENVFEYTFCDKCGSFSIEQKTRPLSPILKSIRVIILILAVTATIGAAIITKVWTVSCIIGVIGLLIFMLISPKSYLQCRKCGNETITDSPIIGPSIPKKDVDDGLTIRNYLHSIIQ